MKKKNNVIISLLIIILLLNLCTNVTNAIGESYKAKTYIDNPIERVISTVKGIMTINGWYMSDDEQAQIKVYIDNQEQEIKELIREDRPDVINGIKGYGGIEENPQPGYSLTIDTSTIKSGKHTLKTDIISRTGNILATDTRTINIQGIYVAKTYTDNPVDGLIPIEKETLSVNGWYMSNDKQAEVKIYIDNQEQEIKELIRENRQDVLNAIKGYGGIEENPTPGYNAKIDISKIKNGIHTIKIEIKSRTGEILATDIRKINVQNYRAKMYVETPKELVETAITGDTINIDGWLMTDDTNSEIKVYIDGKEQKISSTERIERQDVVNSIKGYGNREQNPTPGFLLKIDLANIKDGKHTIKVDTVSRAGEILSSSIRNINLKKYNAKMYVETPKESIETSIIGNEINIDGWLMTDDANSEIKVYIDGKEQQIASTERSERQDVINTIKGYGSSEQNPTPGFSLKMNLTNIKDGKHTLKIDIISKIGEILSSNTRHISLKKYDAKTSIENPVMWGIVKPSVKISGWLMTTDEKSEIKIYVDGKQQIIEEITRTERQDVINSIKGYGGIEQNPTPGYETILKLTNLSEGIHTINIEIVSQEGKIIASDMKYITFEKYKAKTYIETPGEGNAKLFEDNLIIDGWLMTDDVNSQIKIYIDDIEQQNLELTRSERKDVLNSIRGYGSKEENPTPGYSIKLDIEKIKDGKHTLRLDIVSSAGEVIATNTRNIEVNKYKGTLYIELPEVMGQSKNTLTVAGWAMSTDENAKIKIYINDLGQNITQLTRNEREDVINGIKGYGGIEKNPTPGYEAQIDVSKFEDGKYVLRVDVVSREGKIMSTERKNIVIYNKYDLGIDVSRHNGAIDWKQVKNAGTRFAIIRAGFRGYGTSGTLNEDERFVENMKGAISNGIEVGVYFYSQAISEEEAIQEAEMTIRMIQQNGFANSLTYPVVIDTEASGGRADSMTKEQRTAVIRAFCNRIEQAGYKTMIYANKDWLKNNLIMNQLSQYDVWLAHYTGTDDPVNNPSDYQGKYQIWQYTSSGSMSGINGRVDMNISYKKYFK